MSSLALKSFLVYMINHVVFLSLWGAEGALSDCKKRMKSWEDMCSLHEQSHAKSFNASDQY